MCSMDMKKLVWQNDTKHPSYQCPECGWIIHTKKPRSKKKNLRIHQKIS